MAPSDPQVCLGGRHWSHWGVQLGRVRERGVLGGVLLLAGFVQQCPSHDQWQGLPTSRSWSSFVCAWDSQDMVLGTTTTTEFRAALIIVKI